MIIISNVLKAMDGPSQFFSNFWQPVAKFWENSGKHSPSPSSLLCETRFDLLSWCFDSKTPGTQF